VRRTLTQRAIGLLLVNGVGAVSLVWVVYSVVDWLAPSLLCRVGSSEHCAEASHRALSEKPEDAAAFDYATRGCERGSALSCNNLGVCYQRGIGTPKSGTDAMQRYTQACVLGSGLGCYNTADLLSDREGTDKLVTAQLERACTLDLALGCRKASPRRWEDFGKAHALAQRGCDLGDARSCHLATMIAATSEPNSQEAHDGIVKMTANCSEDIENACSNLSLLVAAGLGVSKDLARAHELNRRSCRHGVAASCEIEKEPERLERAANALLTHGPARMLERLSEIRP
jgi:TPR repeat protein